VLAELETDAWRSLMWIPEPDSDDDPTMAGGFWKQLISTNVPVAVLTESLLLSSFENHVPTMYSREFEVGVADTMAEVNVRASPKGRA
jgi:hypothetical protein